MDLDRAAQWVMPAMLSAVRVDQAALVAMVQLAPPVQLLRLIRGGGRAAALATALRDLLWCWCWWWRGRVRACDY